MFNPDIHRYIPVMTGDGRFVPKETKIIGQIPERLGTTAMTIGAAKPAHEIATGYTTRRKNI